MGSGLVKKQTKVEIEGEVWSHGKYKRLTFGSRVRRNQNLLWPWPSIPFQVFPPALTLSIKLLAVSWTHGPLSLPSAPSA